MQNAIQQAHDRIAELESRVDSLESTLNFTRARLLILQRVLDVLRSLELPNEAARRLKDLEDELG